MRFYTANSLVVSFNKIYTLIKLYIPDIIYIGMDQNIPCEF